MPTCVLVDGHYEAFRAYFAMARTGLTAPSTGEPTGAIFGFLRQLLATVRTYEPDYLVVAFDPPHTFRDELYPDYKATRERMPEDLHEQIDRIQSILADMGVCQLTVDGYEADDVIGTLAKRGESEEFNVFIRTGDRDLFQLATERVKIVYGPSRGSSTEDQVYDVGEVETRFGVSGERFIQMKALQGDSSDNIPGVPKVGEKTAVKLLREFESIEGIYARLAEVKGQKLQENLEASREQLQLNMQLVRIDCGVKLDFDWNQAPPFQPNLPVLADSLRKLGLNSTLDAFQDLIGNLGIDLPPVDESSDSDPESLARRGERYLTVRNASQLEELASELRDCRLLAFDFETTSTDVWTTSLVGLALSWDTGRGAYIPLGHMYGEQLKWEDVRPTLNRFMGDPVIPKVAHNAKFDLHLARRFGLECAGLLHDTMIMAFVLDPGRRQLGLKALAQSELGVIMQPIKELIGSGRNQLTMGQVDIDLAAAYAADDAAQTIALFDRFELQLQEEGLWDLYFDLELPLIPVLVDMESRGLAVDRKYLGSLQQEFEERLEELTVRMQDLTGRDFSLRSTYQLSDALFGEDGLGLPTRGLKKLKKGGYSTAAGVLEGLADKAAGLNARQETALNTILEFRQLDKLKSTYVDNLLTIGSDETDKVHTSFHQAGAATGRMSSSDPNLQNIPVRTEEGRRIRRGFVAGPGNVLIAADYNQIELRVLAHMADEARLIRAFEDDRDVHAATASELFGIPIEEVDAERRSLAKTINFATIYGVTKYGLSSRTEMNLEEAEEFLNRYFRTYPRVEQFIRSTVAQVNEFGVVETVAGRRRYFRELAGGKLPAHVRGGMERAAINAPVQGSAADILKKAMRRLHESLGDAGSPGWIVVQVHDELILETPAENEALVARLTADAMFRAENLRVPLKVDVESGLNWRDMTPIES